MVKYADGREIESLSKSGRPLITAQDQIDSLFKKYIENPANQTERAQTSVAILRQSRLCIQALQNNDKPISSEDAKKIMRFLNELEAEVADWRDEIKSAITFEEAGYIAKGSSYQINGAFYKKKDVEPIAVLPPEVRERINHDSDARILKLVADNREVLLGNDIFKELEPLLDKVTRPSVSAVSSSFKAALSELKEGSVSPVSTDSSQDISDEEPESPHGPT